MTPTLFSHEWPLTSAKHGVGEFGNSYGGPPEHAGANREHRNDRLLHLLHRITLSAPVIQLRIPGIQWLPLYYCFDFRVNAFGYQLSSDGEMRVYFWPNEPNVSEREEYPDKDFPKQFPKTGIALGRYAFDP